MIAQVVSANQTAVNDQSYTVLATATFTDPSPVAGKGFTVFVRNGTATVGGVAYPIAGTVIQRIFHSGSWANYAFAPNQSFTFRVELSAAQLLTNNLFVDIPELPAVPAGYAWQVYTPAIKVTLGDTIFDDNVQVAILPQGGKQLFTSFSLNEAESDLITYIIITSIDTTASPIKESAKMVLRIFSNATEGDTTAVVYGMARLIIL
jgi:hypothetical protein